MSLPKSPLADVLVLTGTLAILQPIYALVSFIPGPAPLNLAEVLFRYAIPYTTALWIVADAKERQRTPCFGFGLFVLAMWPLSLFWYCISSRGWRGLGLSLGLIGLACVPAIATFAVFVWAAIFEAILH